MKINTWCLHYTHSNKTLKGLSSEAVISISHAIGSLSGWFIWREGWSHWKLLSECKEVITQPLRGGEDLILPELPKTNTPPPLASVNNNSDEKIKKTPLSDEETYGYQSTITNIGNLSDLIVEELNFSESTDENLDTGKVIKAKKEFLERAYQRIQKELDVEIEVNEKVFKTQTVDVSVGGLCLKDSLPDWVVGYCLLRIIKPHKNEEVELVCSLVENQDPKEKFRLEFSPIEDKNKEMKFAAWLMAA